MLWHKLNFVKFSLSTNNGFSSNRKLHKFSIFAILSVFVGSDSEEQGKFIPNDFVTFREFRRWIIHFYDFFCCSWILSIKRAGIFRFPDRHEPENRLILLKRDEISLDLLTTIPSENMEFTISAKKSHHWKLLLD